MIDYAFKSKVIESGLPLLQKKVSKSKYANDILHLTGEVIGNCIDYNQALEIEKDCLSNNPREWLEAEKINHAYYARVKRLKKKISSMLQSGNCIFLTFTFSDYTLSHTCSNTRRQAVRRFLSQYNTEYVANIDFGKQNGREHYHALILADNVDYSAYKYGSLNGKRVRSSNDYVKLAKYISKLTNHAIKDTARGSRMIYNKN